MIVVQRALVGLVVVVASVFGFADKPTGVTIKGVHLCCGSCSSGAQAALQDVKGIAKIGIDRNTKLISFDADSKDAANAALKALAEDGFYGTATFGKEELKWPDSGAKKGEKVPTIVIEGVHLCCGSCVTGVKEALEKVAGASEIDVDRNAEKVTLKGKEMDEVAVIAALNKGGFFGTIQHEEKKK
ncbi:MAG: putative metal-binding protein [Planctomycetaceae bacterium]|nr:putative metal-binding protein [Planctomycetaceae bacterium]